MVGMVESVRVGTILAHDQRAYDRWRSRAKRPTQRGQRGLTGDALEREVAGIAAMFPANVIRGQVAA